jgi:Cytochrome P450
MMLALGLIVAGVLVVASLPYWLPAAVVALRMRTFARLDGDRGVPVPGDLVPVSEFRRVYEHPAAAGRSRGAALSDLFWYWLAPGPHVHQEHIEAGPRYEEVARTTRQILAAGHARMRPLVAECAARVLDEIGGRAPRTVRLRDLMMPVWAEVYYELVFGERCPAWWRGLIVANADDVATALQCTGLRHPRRRDRLTRFLVRQVESGAVPHELPAGLSAPEQAYYLQGTFFNTAVVQSAEAMAHVLLALATHPEVQRRVVAESGDELLGRVVEETLRCYPLFGIAHRITSAEIPLGERVIPAGSVLCFNYPEFHRSGFDHAGVFDPDRWLALSIRDANHIPFGVAGNRPCPAHGMMPAAMRVVAREVLSRFALFSSAAHTRPMPNRGPCLLVRRAPGVEPAPPTGALALMRVRDRWADVGRGLTQLVLGSYMVWDARRQGLCRRYFEREAATTGR